MRKLLVSAIALLLVFSAGYMAHGEGTDATFAAAGTMVFRAGNACANKVFQLPVGYEMFATATTRYRTTGWPLVQGVQIIGNNLRICLTSGPPYTTGVDYVVAFAPIAS